MQLPFVRAYVASPKGWFFSHKHVQKESRSLFTISKENLDKGEKARSVFNMVVVRGIPEKKKSNPSAFAAEMIQDISKKTNTVKHWEGKRGELIEKGFLREDLSPDNSEKIREYFLTLSNDSTGTIYIISFVAPQERWELDWPIGEIIIKNLRIDETF
ncbi:MAG TPA: hypothetical protein PK821_00570 [Victivallales bacterium]|nr:hypothetical protein [Victivallales bacterium]